MIPAVVIPGVLFTAMALYPFLEAWVTRDYAIHNICDRPRNRPGRTALGVAVLTELGVCLLAGGNDIIAEKYDISLYATTWTFRAAFFVLAAARVHGDPTHLPRPAVRDAHSAEHGYETGRIMMLANGEFIEVEAALPEDVVARMGLEYRQGPPPALEPPVDEHGVRSKSRHNPLEKVRGRIGCVPLRARRRAGHQRPRQSWQWPRKQWPRGRRVAGRRADRDHLRPKPHRLAAD